VHENQ